jgi:hypothetical protein
VAPLPEAAFIPVALVTAVVATPAARAVATPGADAYRCGIQLDDGHRRREALTPHHRRREPPMESTLELENVAAQTYQSNVATFMDPSLNAAIMSVGGVEDRHAAALAGVLKQAQVPAAFQVVDKAVKAGTGV